MYSFNRLFFAKNPLAETGPASKRFYSDLRFQIISQDFSKVIKTVSIAEKWEKRGEFTVKDLEPSNRPHYAFMALGDKITVFNY